MCDEHRSRLVDWVTLCSLGNWCFSSSQLGIMGSTHNISSPCRPEIARHVNSAWWKGQWGGGCWSSERPWPVQRAVASGVQRSSPNFETVTRGNLFFPSNIVLSWKHLLPLSCRCSTANAACNVNGQETNRQVCVHTSFKTQSVSPLWEISTEKAAFLILYSLFLHMLSDEAKNCNSSSFSFSHSSAPRS